MIPHTLKTIPQMDNLGPQHRKLKFILKIETYFSWLWRFAVRSAKFSNATEITDVAALLV